jgi:hypothetical protein
MLEVAMADVYELRGWDRKEILGQMTRSSKRLRADACLCQNLR